MGQWAGAPLYMCSHVPLFARSICFACLKGHNTALVPDQFDTPTYIQMKTIDYITTFGPSTTSLIVQRWLDRGRYVPTLLGAWC